MQNLDGGTVPVLTISLSGYSVHFRRTNCESYWYELDFAAGCCWIPDLLVRHPRAILRDYRKPWNLIYSTGLLYTRITVTYVCMNSNQGLRLTSNREMCGLSWLALSPVVYREYTQRLIILP